MMDRVAKGRSPDRKATGPTPSLFAVSVEAEADTLRMLEQSFPDEPAAITWIGENAEGPGRLDWFRSFRLEAETMAGSVRSRLAAADLTVPVTVREIPAEDWSESWKRHFPVIRVSERLVVAPPWSELEETPGLCVVRIEPGLSFGTGQHGTTKACLFFLDRLQHRLPEAVVLDLGCGSGILAIAAAKLGFPRVLALDHDPEAVRVARENTAANGVADRIEVAVAEVERDRRRTGVETGVDELLAHRHDRVLDLSRRLVRDRSRCPRPGPERCFATNGEPFAQVVEEPGADTVRGAELGHVHLRRVDRHDQTTQRHRDFLSSHDPRSQPQHHSVRDVPRHA